MFTEWYNNGTLLKDFRCLCPPDLCKFAAVKNDRTSEDLKMYYLIEDTEIYSLVREILGVSKAHKLEIN
jgi:hypothetical protein